MSTKIEWTHRLGTKGETWNPGPIGCDHCSPGCDHCYAARRVCRHLSKSWRDDDGQWLAANGRWTGKLQFYPKRLCNPLHWRDPRTVFVVSMGDLFHDDVPFEYIAAVFGVMAACPQHTFQVLTKRPARMRAWFEWSKDYFDGMNTIEGYFDNETKALMNRRWIERDLAHQEMPLGNLWLMTTVENQDHTSRIDDLLRCPAVVHGVSVEPMLGSIDFEHIGNALFDRRAAIRRMMNGPAALNRDQAEDYVAHPQLDWVICGGETGPGARPMHPDWARSLRDQCVAAGVPFFFKQWGEWAVDEMRVCSQKFPQHAGKLLGKIAYLADGTMVELDRVGKRLAGRTLDGQTWEQWPE